jgi:choline dehydrogenase-like flavoprotein
VLLDLRSADDGLSFETDVCVIGAGAAGISLCRHLRKRGHNICLIESGGLDFEQQTQDLYDGPNLGMTYYDLVDARLRFFGGTTNIWGGRCTPLEPLDFERRSWVPHSGWPIQAQTLERHYQIAHASLDLGEYAYDERVWQALGEPVPEFDAERMISRFWRFDTVKERFSAQRCQDLLQDALVTTLLHANVTHLQANPNANGLDHIVVSTLEGRRSQVRARTYVLACGGIENPRLLLAARDVQKNGIGNDNDLVGRFFMEHQHGRAGRVHTEDPFGLWHLFRKRRIARGPPVAPTLLASPDLQRQAGILNTALTFKLQRDPSQGLLLNDRVYRHLKHQLPPDRTRRRLWHAYRDVRGWVQRNLKPKIERLRSGTGTRHLYAMVRAEQAPNPNSRVILSGERDALGVLKASLDWQLSDMDKQTISVLAENLGEELSRLGLGTVEPAGWLLDPSPKWPVDPTVSKHPIGGYHHMGTTRMSSTPRTGVVNEHGRVHGYHNLYIAGSSVFPTGGWANPTLTILALVHRLSEHLDTRLREPRG